MVTTITADGVFALDWKRMLTDAGKQWRVELDHTTPVGGQKTEGAGVSLNGKVPTRFGTGSLRTSPGTLKRSHRFRVLYDQNLVALTNKQVYAAIQEYGGYIPPYDASTKAGKRLKGQKRTTYGTSGGSGVMAIPTAGGLLFRTKRKGFHLPGQHYAELAANAVIDKLKVWWAPKSSAPTTHQRSA